MKRIPPLRLVAIALVFYGCCLPVNAEDYNPLAVANGFKPATRDLTVQDKDRDRDIPLKVYLPASRNAEAVLLFSHGLGGNREGSSYLGQHWAARGYVAAFVQHPGSDDAVWKRSGTLGQRLQTLKAAGNARNFLLRVRDISSVLDQLEKWNKADDHKLQGRLDLTKVGMSGHSFGARTTQAVSGERFQGGRTTYIDDRITAALAMSPSSPDGEAAAKQAFGSVTIPWMLMTGTNDTAPFGNNSDAKSRLGVFPALPTGDKYELVLFEAEHSAFTDHALRRFAKRRDPNHHRAILAISTAFWDVHLRSDTTAQTWLDGPGPRKVLQKDDRWQQK